MKRCPQCDRVESDEALVFCRADGTRLVSDSGSVSGDAGTMRFGSSQASSEVDTSILPHGTDAEMSRPTAPTTVLASVQASSMTRELTQSKRRKLVIAIAFLVFIGIGISGYFYFSQKNSAASIQSIAVMPFVN